MGRDHEKAGVSRIESYLDAFSTGKPEHVLVHVHADFVNRHLGVLGRGCIGKTIYRDRLTVFFSRFLKAKYSSVVTVSNGRSGACHYVLSFEQDEKSYQVPGMMWFEFKDDLISLRMDCWDSLAFAQQGGMSPEDVCQFLVQNR